MTDGSARSATVDVQAARRDDGSIILTNGLALPPVEGTIPGRLKYWAERTPDALFLSQGERLLTYGIAEASRRSIAAKLLMLGISADHPLMIVADNGIDHALIMLAATSVGLPVAIVSTSYIAPEAKPWTKFSRIVEQLEPAILIAQDAEAVRAALGERGKEADVKPLHDLAWLDAIDATPAAMVDAAEASVGLDTVAKLLFTSGSTGTPKAVPNTQRMMVSNMLALSLVWPFLRARPPVSVDWLPWNHTFGGNCCFNTTLWFGGHSHVDSGRPTPAAIGRSIGAIKTWQPTIYYNVPAGFEALLQHLEHDPEFSATFFNRLDFIFNAGAPLPASLRMRLEAVSLATTGKMPNFVGGWGSTETAPFSSILYFDQPFARNLGVPAPGTTLKLIPTDDRYEIRVKGPNVMTGYWRDHSASAEAFDEEGYYRIGDAARFADPNAPAAGLLFEGRVAENFKLASGTWVNVGALRLAIISACEKLISDAVVAGEGRRDVGLLLFPNESACRNYLGEDCSETLPSQHPSIRARIEKLIQTYNGAQMGSSTRVARFEILSEPPRLVDGEITDKGYLNQRCILSRRADLVTRLYQS